MIKLCLIEDDLIMGESLQDRFELEGFQCDWAQNLDQARRLLDKHDYQLVVTDMRLPDGTGRDLLMERYSLSKPLMPWIMLTGFGSVNEAVEMMRLGIVDYQIKPFDLDELIQKIHLLTEHNQANQALSVQLGSSPAMCQISVMIQRLANHTSNILIQGESGVGKERVARLLHTTKFGDNPKHPFVAINCGAIAENLIESELFGHEKGSFTGADRQHKGVFERAHGGTLFLDEIGEMPLNMQVKLLRVLQERNLHRVGGEQAIEVNVQLVSATHQNIQQLIEQGLFREDLYYRIAVFNIDIPPLRDRPEDILPLAEDLLNVLPPAACGGHFILSQLAKTSLLTYSWPGNARQIKNTLQRATVMTEGRVISAEALGLNNMTQNDQENERGLADYLASCERSFIISMLDQHEWRIANTADSLGISRKNLWEKMRRLEIKQA